MSQEIKLSDRRCSACVPGTLPLDPTSAAELHAQLDAEWQLRDDRIVRKFKFKNFADPFGVATRVALLAEQEGHHPDLEVGWGRLVVSLKTHAADGLTENDFIMAAKIDRLSRTA